MRIEQSLFDFYKFLCRPVFNYRSDKPESLRNITLMFFIIFLLEMILAGVLFTAIGIDDSAHKMTELMERFSKWQVIALAVIIAPVFEELIFRFYLRYAKVFSLMLITSLFSGILYFQRELDLPLLYAVLLYGATVLLGVFMLINKRAVNFIESGFKRQFGIVFYFSVIIFAFVHIFNFEEVVQWYHVPIMVLPQFILALYLGYIRVRNNIWSSIYVHSLNNFIPSILLFFVA